MNSTFRLLIVIAVIALPGLAVAHDPGETDTVWIEADPIGVGLSEPVTISIYNDSAIVSWDAHLSFTGGVASLITYDSVKYVGRMADPSVEPVRIVTPRFIDGLSPDSLVIACIKSIGNPLPPGSGPVLELYFTGLETGQVAVESMPTSSQPFGIDFTHAGYHGGGAKDEYPPHYDPAFLNVVQVDQPPEIDVLAELPSVATVHDPIALAFEVHSPSGIPVQVELLSFVDADDDTRLPQAEPSIKETSEAFQLVWNPNPNDIGIWRATVAATDTAGLTTSVVLEIQIVASENYLLPLVRTETRDVLNATGLAHGNLDNDPYPELLVAAHPSSFSPSLGSYNFLDDGRLEALALVSEEYLTRGLVTAYLDDDSHLDAVVCLGFHLRVLAGQGDGSFVANDYQYLMLPGSRDAILINYDGDAYLDYAVVGYDQVQFFRRSAGLSFEPPTLLAVDDTALTINSADFDLDGWDDLAVGTKAGLDIYLNNGAGGYDQGEHHEQVFGTTDITVTNHGSDFNRDGLFDMCLATPSVGGTHSELLVYLGRGDGTFDPHLVRRVRGQIFANRPGDFNGDSYLDIAYINGAEKYLAIIFGDGHGEFPNERRYPVADISPRRLDAVDFDLDGDLDLVVAAYQLGSVLNTGYFVFVNQVDPVGIAPGRLEIRASNNALVELRSPSGGRLSQVVNSMASGEIHRLRLDDNSVIDVVAVSSTVEEGRYDLLVRPRPNLSNGEPYSLSYEVDGRQYRLVDDQPAIPNGLVFPIYPAGSSPVSPVQGDFIHASQPTFTWPSLGVEQFELATDPGFDNVLESAVIDDGVHTLAITLPNSDSAIYYWRVGPESGPASTSIYAFNAVQGPTGIDDGEPTELLPDVYYLAQNYPNPFNPVTTIEFQLPAATPVTITIHNVLGQLVETLVSRRLAGGTHSIEWNATDSRERPVASGIYFFRMEADGFSCTRKMTLLR